MGVATSAQRTLVRHVNPRGWASFDLSIAMKLRLCLFNPYQEIQSCVRGGLRGSCGYIGVHAVVFIIVMLGRARPRGAYLCGLSLLSALKRKR